MSNAETAAAGAKITGLEIHTKWTRIPEHEADRITKKIDLVHQLNGRYSLSLKQAEQDVDAFLNGRTI